MPTSLDFQTRYGAIADHYPKGGLPLTGAGIAPVELTSLSITPPPPAYTPAGAIRTDYWLASNVPYPEPSRPSDQGQRNPVTKLTHNDINALDLTTPAGTYVGFYSPAAVQSTPTSPPHRVPSYYAYAPSSSLPVNTVPSGKGWEYIVPPAGSPPPPDIGHQ